MPIRKGRGPFATPVSVGDNVITPSGTDVTVTNVGKRYFSGNETLSGKAYGETGIGLLSSEGLAGSTAQWQVRRRTAT